MIADARAPFARPSGRELQEREKGTAPSTDPARKSGDRDLLDKDRPIDPMSGRNSPAKGPNRFRAQWTSGRAPALHAASISQPLPFDASLPLCPCDANAGRFPSGASRAPFIQRWVTIQVFHLLCKENEEEILPERRRQRLARWRSAASPARPYEQQRTDSFMRTRGLIAGSRWT